MSKDKNVLTFPRFYRMVSLALFIFSVIGCVCILAFQFDEWRYTIILVCVFGLPGLTMFTMWSLWRVDIIEDGFVYRNYIGITRIYRYEDLEYSRHPKGLVWNFYKDGKRVLRMAYYIENGNRLDELYHKYIRKLNKK